MGRQASPSEIDVRVLPRPGDSSIHPVEIGAAPWQNRPPAGLSSEAMTFRRWRPWLVPTFILANIVLFAITMFFNDCPKRSPSCVVSFLGRFSFQPLRENPLLGPSSNTFAAKLRTTLEYGFLSMVLLQNEGINNVESSDELWDDCKRFFLVWAKEFRSKDMFY